MVAAQLVAPSSTVAPKFAVVIPAKADAFSVKVSARAMSSAFKVRFSRPLLVRFVGLAVRPYWATFLTQAARMLAPRSSARLKEAPSAR